MNTPYGEPLENTLESFSEFGRFMIADRMRWGKRSKAKQGKLVASPQSDYGFRYNETRVINTPTPVDTRRAPCSSSLTRSARSQGGGKGDRC